MLQGAPASLKSAVRPVALVLTLDALYPGHSLKGRSVEEAWSVCAAEQSPASKPRHTRRALIIIRCSAGRRGGIEWFTIEMKRSVAAIYPSKITTARPTLISPSYTDRPAQTHSRICCSPNRQVLHLQHFIPSPTLLPFPAVLFSHFSRSLTLLMSVLLSYCNIFFFFPLYFSHVRSLPFVDLVYIPAVALSYHDIVVRTR